MADNQPIDEADTENLLKISSLTIKDLLQFQQISPSDLPAEMFQILEQLMTENNEHEFNTLRQKVHQECSNMVKALDPNAGEEQVEFAANFGLSVLDATFNQKAPVEKIIDAVGSHNEQLPGSDEPESEDLWSLINYEVYENIERYLHYTNSNSTQSATSFEPSDTNSTQSSTSFEPSNTNSTQSSTSFEPSDTNSTQPSTSLEPSNTNSTQSSTSFEPSDTNSTQPSTSFEPSNNNNSEEQNSTQLDSVLNDVIVNIVLQSLANCVRKIVCLFEFGLKWSGIFLPVHTTNSSCVLLIVKLKNMYTATTDINEIRKFVRYQEIIVPENPLQIHGEKTIDDALELLQYPYTKFLTLATAQKSELEGKCAQYNELDGYKHVLTGSAKEKYHAMGASDEDYLVELNETVFNEEDFDFSHTIGLNAYLTLILDCKKRKAFEQKDSELKNFLTKLDGEGNRWFLNAHLLKKAFKEYVFDEGKSTLKQSLDEERELISPAITMTDSQGNHEVDLVVSLRFSGWPRIAKTWENRKRPFNFPSKHVMDDIINGGFHVVPKASVKQAIEREWRLSFSISECKLIDSFDENQGLVYYVMKSIHSFFFKKYNFNVMISSYHIKTMMFLMCEVWPTKQWKDHKKSIAMLFKLLSLAFSRKKLPHYFINTHNLIYNLDDAQCNAFKVSLAVMNTQLEKILRFYIINANGIALFPRSIEWQINMIERTRKGEATSATKIDDGRKEEAISVTKSDILDVHAVNSLRDYGDEIERDMQSTSGAKMFIARVIGPSIHSELVKKRNSPHMRVIPVALVNSVVLFATRFLEAFCKFTSDDLLRFHVFFTFEEISTRTPKVQEIEKHYGNSMQILDYLADRCIACTPSNATDTTITTVKFIYKEMGKMGESLDKLVSLYRDKMDDNNCCIVTFAGFASFYFPWLTKEIMHRRFEEKHASKL